MIRCAADTTKSKPARFAVATKREAESVIGVSVE